MKQSEGQAEPIFAQPESIDLLGAALRFYRSALRRKWVVFTSLAISFSLAGTYYMLAERRYASRAELIVLQSGGNVLDREHSNRDELRSQMPNFERILQSDNVLKDALKQLPEEHRVDFNGVDSSRWIEHFRQQLSVSTLRNTNVIAVSYQSVSPETAYIVVQSVIDAYLSEMNSMHQATAQKLLNLLENEKANTERDLRAKEQEYLRLRARTQVIFGTQDQPTNVLNERVIKLNQELTDAKVATANARALLVSIETAYRNGEDLQDFATQISETLGMRLLEHHSGLGGEDVYAVSRINQELLDNQSALETLLETRGPKHPEVIELKARIERASNWLNTRQQLKSAALDKMSAEELGPNLLNIARRRYQAAYDREQEALRQYIFERDEAAKVGDQLAQLDLLENEMTQLENYFNIILDSVKEQSLSKQSGITSKTITPPSLDNRPVTPKLSVTILLAMIFGSAGGVMGVYMMDLVDDRFHSPDDLKMTIGTTILAMIRKLQPLAPNGLASIYPYAKPNSVESEAFRSLRTTIDFHPDDLRRVTISSTEPSDGKTTVLVSLGVAFAQAGKKTLVIDGDMRRPGTTRLFDLSSSQGLSSILKEDTPIAESANLRVFHTELKGLDIIPAGPRPVNPVELLASERFADLIAWAESNYDQLLIDAPPSLAVADVQVIGRVVDGAILIVRPDKNRRKMVIRAAEALTNLGCRLIGMVVNHVEPKHGGDYAYGYGYGYGEGYGHDEENGRSVEHSKAA